MHNMPPTAGAWLDDDLREDMTPLRDAVREARDKLERSRSAPDARHVLLMDVLLTATDAEDRADVGRAWELLGEVMVALLLMTRTSDHARAAERLEDAVVELERTDPKHFASPRTFLLRAAGFGGSNLEQWRDLMARVVTIEGGAGGTCAQTADCAARALDLLAAIERGRA